MTPMDDLGNYKLGETNELLRATTREDCRLIALAIASQAQHSLSILSHNMEPDLYNTPSFYEAARDVLAADSRSVIRILVSDVSRLVLNGHRLLDLSRRQSSRVQIRKLNNPIHHAFLVADEIAVLDRRRAERFEATANFNDQGWANNLLHFFNQTWERCSPSSELQTLNI
jgi:hypothetical protein